MSVRFGVNPIGWSNDDLRELGGKTPLETCLKEAKQAGYEGIELGHKFPREAKALKAVLSQAGLDLVSGWYSSELLLRDAKEEMKHLRAHLDLLKALGSNILIFAETSNATHGDRSKPLSKRPKLKADRLARVRPAHDRGRRGGGQGRRRPRLSSSHGHGGAERRGHRRLHGIRPATR